MKKLFLDDIQSPGMVYAESEALDFKVVRTYTEFVAYINQNGEVAPDGYAGAKWLVYESGLDLRGLKFHVHSANPVAAEQIRGLLDNYIKYLKIGL